MRMFIVTMRRWGEVEGHQYIIGAYNNLADAVVEGLSHQIFRDNKYEPFIQKVTIDSTEVITIDLEVAIDYTVMKYPEKFNDRKQLIDE